jgi:hypothetical protein
MYHQIDLKTRPNDKCFKKNRFSLDGVSLCEGSASKTVMHPE